MNKSNTIKRFGNLLVLVAIASIIVFIGYNVFNPQHLAQSYTDYFYDLTFDGLIPALGILIFILPVGMFYYRKGKERIDLVGLQKVALWLHYLTFLLLIIAMLPWLRCFWECDSFGEAMISITIAVSAGIIYGIGILLLIFQRFRN